MIVDLIHLCVYRFISLVFMNQLQYPLFSSPAGKFTERGAEHQQDVPGSGGRSAVRRH